MRPWSQPVHHFPAETLLRCDRGQPAQKIPATQIHEHAMIITAAQDTGERDREREGHDGHSFSSLHSPSFTELRLTVCDDDWAMNVTHRHHVEWTLDRFDLIWIRRWHSIVANVSYVFSVCVVWCTVVNTTKIIEEETEEARFCYIYITFFPLHIPECLETHGYIWDSTPGAAQWW